MLMSVECIQCKTGESYRVLRSISIEGMRPAVFNQTSLLLEYEEDFSRMISMIMKLCKSEEYNSVVLMNPFEWWICKDASSAAPRIAGDGNEDSEDSDSELNSSGSGRASSRRSSSLEYIFPLVSWFATSRDDLWPRLILAVEGVIPRELLRLDVKVVEDYFSETRAEAKEDLPMEIGGTLVQATSRCICIRGSSQCGKSRALFALDSEAVWLRTHEIVDCQLGESPRLVRRAFQRAASGRISNLVLLDDADLLLTIVGSGRVVKEIVEEIGNCISDFRSSVRFVFTVSSNSNLDAFIMSKVDQTIDLG